ncbi:MAG: glycosyltransferase [Lachnoclostridium sp.]|nr:glycosyltransferase [Lachnospira sp.]MCM1247410.1 glycosyltransferase [Lachnoclostridium sp.]MCM1536718.1 glycosyltransferase [Clostridium sp.]
MRFSIIVVCLNPGKKLSRTMDSILSQTCQDFEVIVKDGGSRDGSVEDLKKKAGISENERIRFYEEKDSGIYDAMNQAVSHAQSEFILFMNCGDVFFDREVLEKTAQYIEAEEAKNAGSILDNLILYGNTYSEKNKVIIASPPRITGFTCYRNIPCHQSCVYAARLCREKPYDLQYKIRADYDHFLWCYYRAGAKVTAMNLTVASYEGGGFSENKENGERDKREHKLITETYMKKGEIFRYKLMLWCTLAPLRKWLAESPVFSGMYHRIKEKIYR